MKLVFHLGFNRTSTKTLQKHLSAKHSHINYFGKHFKSGVSAHLQLIELLSHLGNDEFEKKYKNLIKMVKELKLVENKI